MFDRGDLAGRAGSPRALITLVRTFSVTECTAKPYSITRCISIAARAAVELDRDAAVGVAVGGRPARPAAKPVHVAAGRTPGHRAAAIGDLLDDLVGDAGTPVVPQLGVVAQPVDDLRRRPARTRRRRRLDARRRQPARAGDRWTAPPRRTSPSDATARPVHRRRSSPSGVTTSGGACPADGSTS